MSPPTKRRLRRRLRQQRQALARSLWQVSSDRICAHLAADPLFQQAQTVAAYVSHQQEPCLAQLWTDDPTDLPQTRRWGFPRCVGQHLCWHLCAPTDPHAFQRGTYGLWEPHPDRPTLDPALVDLMLVPAVACDRNGYRLGYGGGYYDRLLSHPAWQHIPTIGITFAFAYLPELPTEPWDRPLTAICTELGVHYRTH